MKYLKCATFLLTIIVLTTNHPNAQNFLISDVITSARDVSVGVVKHLDKVSPSPFNIFQASKQLLVGYPYRILAKAINTVCSIALSTKTIRPRVTPDIEKIQFQLRTACRRYSFPILSVDQIWRILEFDRNKKVVILATGWSSTANETDAIYHFAKAFNCRGDANFIAVDAASFVDTLYTWAAFNTDQIGEYIAHSLVLLTRIVPLANIHLIGISLGAHIVGAAGRHFNVLTGLNIPHITGLDPANTCFNEGENLPGLYRGNADFVDVIHSNSGVLGKRDPMGDVDFYPGGLGPLPPGCVNVFCAHDRAWKYYVETVYPGNERNFMARPCTSLLRLHHGKCRHRAAAMGYATPHNLKGNYFLDVRPASPFGWDCDKSCLVYNKKKITNCGLCNSGTFK